jgi:glutamate dehydrogenase (NAD(P)+)
LAAEDHTGSIVNPDGIDADDLAAHVARTGGVADYPRARLIDHEAFLSTRADFFVPAALEGQIAAKSAPLLNVRAAFQGANDPIDLDGDRILADRGIELLPAILANGGCGSLR